jgi:hypothetical protein
MLNPLVLALSVAAPAASAQPAPPIACRAGALDESQRRRQQELLDEVRRRVLGTHELPDGLALSFPPEPALFLELAEWVSLERRCCPFLAFALEWGTRDEILVRLTGQPGVKDAIAAELGIPIGR